MTDEPITGQPAEEPPAPPQPTAAAAAPEPAPPEPAAPPAAIETAGLTRVFGRDVVAVDDVALRVPPGELFGLLGPDGAGKSTLIRMLASVLSPTRGDALIFGRSAVREPALIKPRIGYMSQAFGLYGDLTVMENIRFFSDLRGVPRQEYDARATRLLGAAGLAEFQDRFAGQLSGGMKQKLALVVTLMHEPDLLLLDEPTTGVDPVSRREFWRIISSLHRSGTTILVATPYMDEAERCTRVGFMRDGRIALAGAPAEIKAMVPGTLYEIDTDDERAARAILSNAPGVESATLFGSAVRALTDEHTDGDMLAALLAEHDVTVTRVEAVAIDMEASFAHLFGEGRRPSHDEVSSEAIEAPAEGGDEE